MPFIRQVNEIEITPEKYLRGCTDDELKETLLLLNSKQYASRIRLEEDSEIEYGLRDVAKELNGHEKEGT